LHHHHRFQMPIRNVARLVHRWNLHAAPMWDEAKSSGSPAIKQWLSKDYKTHQIRAWQAKGQILWIGERSIPGSTCYQLFSHTLRGNLQFLITQQAANLDAWKAFLLGLYREFDKKIFVVLANPYLPRPDALGPWLSSHRDD